MSNYGKKKDLSHTGNYGVFKTQRALNNTYSHIILNSFDLFIK